VISRRIVTCDHFPASNVPPVAHTGAGALAGTLGLSTFELMRPALGLRTASMVHVAFEACVVVAAALAFEAFNMNAFMAFVCLSRIGL